MKIYGKMRCEYWSDATPIEIETPDDATEEEIEKELWEAAVEAAKIEVWRTGEDGEDLE